MTTALVLLGYAGLLGLAGPRIVDRARWAVASPRLAIATWFALAASFILSLVLAGAAIMTPTEIFTGDLAAVRDCVTALREHHGAIGGTVLALLAAALTWAVPLRLACALIAVARTVAADRSRLRRELRGGRRDRGLGAVVVESPQPAAYCIPGEGGLVAITSGALQLLDRPQLEAVLAHERAHLAGRHHLLIALAQAANRAFGWVPLFTRLPVRVGHLVELAADDAAARRASRRILARSLLNVATAQTPAEALAASGGDTVARVERLLHAPPAPGPAGVGTILGGNAAAVAAPILVVALPVLTAVGMACC
ncbi:M56 family metallopeptidase [Glycomyces luteolus]|uniref:M56 family metallopeptidase n=1 Tax=Glycomyces luteolus TaxID=2670330 RepID=A0A9X3PEF6_9ACTN|nr:M56 family metallopeptidase [Glycomyces luteolus]MDA1361084.1 M56 family metallopeptidase [Glycomyces luteolus]